MPKLSREEYDPIFLHARREALIVVSAWLVFLLWVVGYSGWNAYDSPGEGETVATLFGMPAWVFWGVAAPWIAANVFTFWFAFRCMTDDPLHEPDGEQSVHAVEPAAGDKP